MVPTKAIVMATAAMLLLSLSGGAPAQKEGPAPVAPPSLEKQTPAAPVAQPPMAPKGPQMTPAEPTAATTAQKSRVKAKKLKRAKREKALKEKTPEE